VDGAIRDTDETRDLGFQIFSKAIVPRSTHSPFSGRTDPIEVNGAIQCAGVLVNPGDLVLGDEIGVVVIPLDKAAEILEKARTQADNEEKTRARIREGKTVDQILAEFGRM
jgi:regulator of RNase E activity RraA